MYSKVMKLIYKNNESNSEIEESIMNNYKSFAGVDTTNKISGKIPKKEGQKKEVPKKEENLKMSGWRRTSDKWWGNDWKMTNN